MFQENLFNNNVLQSNVCLQLSLKRPKHAMVWPTDVYMCKFVNQICFISQRTRKMSLLSS